jgi:carbamoyl-phosphate synthase small subunit
MHKMQCISINTYLVLEDGTVFPGLSVGASGVISAEIAFTTTMAGYQEAVTDPSYRGQALVFSYPLVGNYGINPKATQSQHAQTRAVVMRKARNEWSTWLRAEGVVALSEVDTRSVVRHVRSAGAMRCAVGAGEIGDLLRMAHREPHIDYGRALKEPGLAMPPLALEVSVRQPYQVGTGPRVVVVDLGCKTSVIGAIAGQGMEACVVPATYGPDEILDLRPRAVLIGNGPGDPAQLVDQVDTIKSLLGIVPLFGICLGHQLISLAVGMSTFKLPFGHRGTNHPVRENKSGRVMVTSQNHGFAVEAGDLGIVTHISLNDSTVEGIRGDGFIGVQFHPEAAPGPTDGFGFFDELEKACRRVPTSTPF